MDDFNSNRMQYLLSCSVYELDISQRDANALYKHGIRTVKDLLMTCPKTQSQCHRECGCRKILTCYQGGVFVEPVRLASIHMVGQKTVKSVIDAAHKFLQQKKAAPPDYWDTRLGIDPWQ